MTIFIFLVTFKVKEFQNQSDNAKFSRQLEKKIEKLKFIWLEYLFIKKVSKVLLVMKVTVSFTNCNMVLILKITHLILK